MSGSSAAIASRALSTLARPDVGGPVDDLALQVADVHDVVVDDPDRPDAGRREVLQHRRTEPAGADDAHARVPQPPLPVDADLREQQVPRPARELLTGQRRPGRDQGRQRHDDKPTSSHSVAGSRAAPAAGSLRR